MSGGSKHLHGGIRKANNQCKKNMESAFAEESYSTANICSGSGQREQELGAQDKEGQSYRTKKGREKKTTCLERTTQEDT